MARLRSQIGRIGSSYTLVTRFYQNGALFNPYSVSSVEIYDAQTGGTLMTTLTPVQTSTGVYEATWNIPTGTRPQFYYDRWTWKAQVDMTTQVRTYSFRVDGDYSTERPRPATGPLFVGQKEITFFNSVNKELIQRIIGQRVTYYAVSEQHTKTHRIYDEAVKKTTYRPVDLNALILYNEPVQSATQFSIDTVYSIEVYMHIHELRERNLVPREGDFVKFGNIVYEIEKLNKPQLVYGQIDNQVMVKAICRASRESQFKVME